MGEGMVKRAVWATLAVAIGLGGNLSCLAYEHNPSGEADEATRLAPDLKNGLVVYEVCAACHLPEGWGDPDGSYPQIAGQHRNVLIKQLADIRALNRANPAMYPFSLPEAIGGVQAVADVTAYISKLPMTPDHGKGPWGERTLEYGQGERLYNAQCLACHGKRGEGSDQGVFPRIQGQHYQYMLRQFEWIRDGRRRNANPAMVEQIKGFSDRETRMVINYASQLPVPREDLAPSVMWKNPDFQ